MKKTLNTIAKITSQQDGISCSDEYSTVGGALFTSTPFTKISRVTLLATMVPRLAHSTGSGMRCSLALTGLTRYSDFIIV